MTAGSLYQINNASHNNNNFLELNPQISFFKIVYRKYSLFACENIKFDNLTRTTLSYDNNVTIKCNIPRNADLLKNLYLTFELPAIYSTQRYVGSNIEGFFFKWIKNIGLNIFEHVSFRINDQEIDKLYSDYINIWKELTLNYDEKEQFNKSIGDIKEIYDPANGLGQSGNYPHTTNSHLFPSSDSNSINYAAQAASKRIWYMATTTQQNLWLDGNNSPNSPLMLHPPGSNTGVNEYTFPSILSRKIKVPLPFFFANNSGLALPLIALQNSICSLEFYMRKVRDLYTIIGADDNTTKGKRIKPTNTDYHKLDTFTKNFSSYDFKFNVEGEFIFLGEQERTRFAIHDHEYLIEQSKLGTPTFINIKANSTNTKVKLLAFNPIKYMTWVVKRDDYDKLNNWNNYTNWVDEDIPPYSYENIKNWTASPGTSGYYIPETGVNPFYTGNGSYEVSHGKYFSETFLKKEILTNVKLEFDGKTRIDKNIEYFGKQQILQNFKRNAKDGIYIYSFSLDPLEFQPSGTCNFSDIYEPFMYFTKEDMGDFSNLEGGYDYKCFIYLINYNILTIKSGIGALKFVS